MNLGLSKSKYCKGIQCPKILWMDKYKPEEAEDVLPEAVLANGNKVGDVARRYFGFGKWQQGRRRSQTVFRPI